MKKKLVATILVLVLLISFATVSFAADIDDPISYSCKPITLNE